MEEILVKVVEFGLYVAPVILLLYCMYLSKMLQKSIKTNRDNYLSTVRLQKDFGIMIREVEDRIDNLEDEISNKDKE